MFAILLLLGALPSADVAGVRVTFVNESSSAKLAAEAIGEFELRIEVNPQTERDDIELYVELPISGPQTWPINDVVVLDASGVALPVRRAGIEWHKLLITIPPQRCSLLVRAVEPGSAAERVRSERVRRVTCSRTGVSATIANWHDGRRTALSIRFDDSHPSHLSTVIPILNEYGFRGTFMINPGGHPQNSRRRSAFEDHRAEWEAVAKRGAHEFANHTLNHRGAENDQEMEHEVGEAAKAIWQLFPDKSKLAALNLGGGTYWVTTRPLRYYLDKYHLFDASANSTGMDDTYGNRVEIFRGALQSHLERGLWLRVHYHSIGAQRSASEAHFREAMDIALTHRDQLWIAGMADIHKYSTERRGAALKLQPQSESRVILKLDCATDPELYDQPLTLEVTVPEAWARGPIFIKNRLGEELEHRLIVDSENNLLRCNVRPVDAEFVIGKREDGTRG